MFNRASCLASGVRRSCVDHGRGRGFRPPLIHIPRNRWPSHNAQQTSGPLAPNTLSIHDASSGLPCPRVTKGRCIESGAKDACYFRRSPQHHPTWSSTGYLRRLRSWLHRACFYPWLNRQQNTSSLSSTANDQYWDPSELNRVSGPYC